MLFKATLLAAAASIVSACAPYPPPLSAQSGGNAVSRPDLNNFPTIGQPFSVVWDATSWGSTVTIYLLRGPGENIQYNATLTGDAPNSGTFTWTPDCHVEPDTTHWGLMVESNDFCTFQWSSQFGINADTTGLCSTPSSSAPAASSSAPPASSSAAPPASSSGSPPPVSSGSPPPPKSSGGAPYPVSSNCTSTSTVWVNPTGGYTPPKASYTPAYSNDGARFGMSMLGAAAAIAAAVMYL